jgi:hypothetical protein
MEANSHEAIVRRWAAGRLTWHGSLLVLLARTAFGVAAQASSAALLFLGGSPAPWRDAEAWLPVYGTLIDAGCLALLWRLTRGEGIGLWALVGFERARLAADPPAGPGAEPSMAIAVVTFAWSLQHACMPLTFDAHFGVFRLLASVPSSVFETLVHLRLRRLLPLALAHA